MTIRETNLTELSQVQGTNKDQDECTISSNNVETTTTFDSNLTSSTASTQPVKIDEASVLVEKLAQHFKTSGRYIWVPLLIRKERLGNIKTFGTVFVMFNWHRISKITIAQPF